MVVGSSSGEAEPNEAGDAVPSPRLAASRSARGSLSPCTVSPVIIAGAGPMTVLPVISAGGVPTAVVSTRSARRGPVFPSSRSDRSSSAPPVAVALHEAFVSSVSRSASIASTTEISVAGGAGLALGRAGGGGLVVATGRASGGRGREGSIS
jgi:hypothetical protein